MDVIQVIATIDHMVASFQQEEADDVGKEMYQEDSID